MHDNELDALFKSKLKNLEATPADKAWDSIVLELDGAKRKNNLWLVILAAVMIIAILFIGGLFIAKNIHSNTVPAQTNRGLIVDKDI